MLYRKQCITELHPLPRAREMVQVKRASIFTPWEKKNDARAKWGENKTTLFLEERRWVVKYNHPVNAQEQWKLHTNHDEQSDMITIWIGRKIYFFSVQSKHFFESFIFPIHNNDYNTLLFLTTQHWVRLVVKTAKNKKNPFLKIQNYRDTRELSE